MKSIKIYSDGACSGNPGPGGWGAVLIYEDNIKEISGSEQATTNNKMELMAAIKAIEAIKESCKIDIYTDSVYVKEGITNWIIKWKSNNWRNSQKKSVKNIELWQLLDQVIKKHEINWHWVKGHNNDFYNNRADLLATKARDKAKNIISSFN